MNGKFAITKGGGDLVYSWADSTIGEVVAQEAQFILGCDEMDMQSNAISVVVQLSGSEKQLTPALCSRLDEVHGADGVDSNLNEVLCTLSAIRKTAVLLDNHGAVQGATPSFCSFQPYPFIIRNSVLHILKTVRGSTKAVPVLEGFKLGVNSIRASCSHRFDGAVGRLLEANNESRWRYVLIIKSVSSQEPLDTNTIRTLFDLTRAEARAVEAIYNGLSIKILAQREGLSLGTIRSQVKSSFSKMGVRRQVDLLRKLQSIADA